MADQVVQLPVDGAGKKVDASELLVGANTVERQRVNLSDPVAANAHAGVVNATPVVSDYGLETRIIPDTYSALSLDVSASGDTIVHTPAGGKAMRLHYICLSANSSNSASVDVIVKFDSGGSTLYKLSMRSGTIWSRNIGAGRRYLQGGTNLAVYVNLSAAQTVSVSIEYEEI